MARAGTLRVAGLMSGTSLDGIDVAIVDIGQDGIKTMAHATVRYSDIIRGRILAVSNTTCQTRDISRLNFKLGELYAGAIRLTAKRAGIRLKTIDLIGSHGQTIYHEGSNTFQIGEAAVIAERLRIPVVSDFRTRDIAAGGHGAPLVPFVDDLLFRDRNRNRVALNVGGIANVTVLSKKPVIAFDTGPGNMVIDQLMAPKRYDKDGKTAAKGKVNVKLLNQLLSDPYYRMKPPKTAGREQYGREFIARLLGTKLPHDDLVATAAALTAATIAIAIKRFAPDTHEVIAAGGGVHNPYLMGQLQAFLPGARLATTAEFGIHPDAKEAIAFALLAARTIGNLPGNLPSATGANRPVILGKLTPA